MWITQEGGVIFRLYFHVCTEQIILGGNFCAKLLAVTKQFWVKQKLCITTCGTTVILGTTIMGKFFSGKEETIFGFFLLFFKKMFCYCNNGSHQWHQKIIFFSQFFLSIFKIWKKIQKGPSFFIFLHCCAILQIFLIAIFGLFLQKCPSIFSKFRRIYKKGFLATFILCFEKKWKNKN